MADSGNHSNSQVSYGDIQTGRMAEISVNTLQRPTSKINQLPPEILHITQGYISLQTLIARLAQKTHKDLIKTVKDLVQMPLPASKSNSNESQIMTIEDTSAESLTKKLRILKFATDAHEAWTKALVITGWSRKAEDVSKIIDLKVHLDQRQQDYVAAIDQMAHDKRGYIHARLPNPDIKTALEVMGTGKASWMPELGYIPPPKLNARDIMEVLTQLNTILSIRLNLDEYESIPYHFKNFQIESGRVTFKVAGEFELDLTVAEEALEAQYWFLDLRFLFSPSLNTLSQGLWHFLEREINKILLKDGLNGCYDFLHDLVLTYKISELRKQADVLAKHRWIHSVKVEVLNRSICIQYWSERFHKAPKEHKTPKNWLIIGVHSGSTKKSRSGIKVTRRLGIRWFRENKEQKDVDIPINVVNLSVESLLTTVVSKHITYILTSINEKLRAKPLYVNHDLSISLLISPSDPANSELKVQLTSDLILSVRIEPTSGFFIFEPPTRRILDYQRRLNTSVIDLANRAHECIELLRYSLIHDSLVAYGWTTGFKNIRNPGVNNLEMKRVFKDAAQVHWFSRSNWPQRCYLTISMNVAGESWSLIQTAIASDPTNPNGVMIIPTQIKMPIRAISPSINYKFMLSIYILSVALLSYHGNLKYLWAKRHLYMLIPNIKRGPLNFPFIYIKLSELLGSFDVSSKTVKPWAKDFVRLSFQGVQSSSHLSIFEKHQKPTSQASQAPDSETLSNLAKEEKEDQTIMVAEILLQEPISRPLSSVHKEFDHNIVFHPSTGTFAIRLCSSIGMSLIPALIQNLVKVERLVKFIKSLEKHEATLKVTKICLSGVAFAYGGSKFISDDNITNLQNQAYLAAIEFSPERENHLILEFKKGNPHLRIADHLTNLLNSSQGLDAVAKVITLTTTVLLGIEAIEKAWLRPASLQYGTVIVNARAADWYIIRYVLTQKKSNSPNFLPQLRKFVFEIRMRNRKGEAWWHVRRHEPPMSSASLALAEVNDKRIRPDDLDEALLPLWKTSMKHWQGMGVGAVSRCDGIIQLLTMMDDIVRNFISNSNKINPLKQER